MKILHVVPRLLPGGAEMILKQLVIDVDIGRHSHCVICLGDARGELVDEFKRAGIPIASLGIEPQRPPTFARVLNLRREIEYFRPDLIQTWMYHANLLAGLVARMFSTTPVLWSLHHDVSDRSLMKPLTKGFVWLGGVFSFFVPARIVSVSERAVRSHSALGYNRAKMVTIPNGIDTQRFSPYPKASARLRAELGLPSDIMLVGFVARYHPMKGHGHFLAAAEILSRSHPQVHFLLCGQGVDQHNQMLVSEIEKRGLQDAVHLLGHRDDVHNLLPGLDIYSISSLSEAFPLSVGEAMASGLPCVTTDVGDSSWLVGETGLVVPPANPAALAAAWRDLLSRSRNEREALGRAARQRVVENFSLQRMRADYARLYSQISGTNS